MRAKSSPRSRIAVNSRLISYSNASDWFCSNDGSAFGSGAAAGFALSLIESPDHHNEKRRISPPAKPPNKNRIISPHRSAKNLWSAEALPPLGLHVKENADPESSATSSTILPAKNCCILAPIDAHARSSRVAQNHSRRTNAPPATCNNCSRNRRSHAAQPSAERPGRQPDLRQQRRALPLLPRRPPKSRAARPPDFQFALQPGLQLGLRLSRHLGRSRLSRRICVRPPRQ